MTWEQQIGGFVLSVVCFWIAIEIVTGSWSWRQWFQGRKDV